MSKEVIGTKMYESITFENTQKIIDLVETKNEEKYRLQVNKEKLRQLREELDLLYKKIDKINNEISSSKGKISNINWNLFKARKQSKKINKSYISGQKVNTKKYNK